MKLQQCRICGTITPHERRWVSFHWRDVARLGHFACERCRNKESAQVRQEKRRLKPGPRTIIDF